MIGPIVLALVQAAQPASASADAPAEVVVRARRLRQANDECLAGRCATPRDAQVSIAMAEQQFRDGRYRDAMKTLAASIDRNRRFTATYPRSVAALYEAYATVLLHEGEAGKYRTAVGNRVRALRDHLPREDFAVREAELAVGDMWSGLGFIHNAELSYEAAENRARAAGQAHDAVYAAVRRIWLIALDGRVDTAQRLLATLASDPIATGESTTRLLAVLRLKIALRFADEGEAERALRALGIAASADSPILVWAPPYGWELPRRKGPDTSTINYDVPVRGPLTLPPGRPVDWLDVGFWITPAGRVTEVEPLRGTAIGSDWAKVVTTQVAGRRYEPFDGSTRQDVYRLQRFTLRASYGVAFGSLARSRSGPVDLEVTDLTDPAAIAEPHGGSVPPAATR